MNKLLIVGAGEHGMVAKETAETMKMFDKIDFLDDHSDISIGKFNEYGNFLNEYKYAFVALGNIDFRMAWINKLSEAGYELINLIHEHSYVSPSATLENGIIIEAGAIINSNSFIGKGTIISIGALVDHNSSVDKGCHVKAGAVIKPNTVVNVNTVIEENTIV